MTAPIRIGLGTFLAGLWLSDVASAHHPGSGGESSWSWLLLLSFVLVYIAIRVGAALLPKRKAPPSDQQGSSGT